MKAILCGIACLFSFSLHSFEYEVLFENEEILFARAEMMAHEEIGLHRDDYRKIVFALKGGVITRIEADGTANDVEFPTGVAVIREMDPPNEYHRGINKGSEPVEILMINLKPLKSG